MSRAVTNADLVQFVLDEARLLNSADYRSWLELFDHDARYWVPLAGDRQPDPERHASIAYEDRLLLAVRIERLASPRAHSLEPGVRSLHVLHPPHVESARPDDQLFGVMTPFVYTEVKGTRQMMLAGVWRHCLRSTPAGLRIVLKRVDLLNAGDAHEAVQLFP